MSANDVAGPACDSLAELIEQVRAGSQSAAQTMYERYQPLVVGLIRRGAAETPTRFSCCHLQVYRLIRQDLAAFALFQTSPNLPLEPIGKFLPIAVQFDAAQV